MFVRYTVMCIEIIEYTQILRALSLIIPQRLLEILMLKMLCLYVVGRGGGVFIFL